MAKKLTSLLFLPIVFSLVLVLLLLHPRPIKSQSLFKIYAGDLVALREIKNTLTDIPSAASAPHFFATWNFSADPCTTFAGVTCSAAGRVTILTLGTGLSDSPGLAGTLSPAIGNLADLTQLILFAGIVTGPIPPQLGSLQNIKVISLTNNRLTGPIPVQITRLPSLHTLDLSHNYLSGTVPPTLSSLNSLKVLVLASNIFSGRLPRKLPPQLLHLDVSGNFFSGTLPPAMPAALRYFSAGNNRMWGSINGVDSLSELEYLDLSMNRFNGQIPWKLFRSSIRSILLQRNNLSGRVPQSQPWDYVAGSTVDLSHNFLSGELTTVLIGVESLFLNNNRLTGHVPREYVDSVKAGNMKTLYLQHNYITSFPLEVGSTLPDAVAVCVSYNCMAAPPVGLAACPASAGDQLSRPANQCSVLHSQNSSSLG